MTDKIKHVQEKQIWTFNDGKTYDIVIGVYPENIIHYGIYGDFDYALNRKKERGDMHIIDIEYCKENEEGSDYIFKMFLEPEKYLIGHIGETHIIENGKLIEKGGK
jgi:hypothetical protein